MNQFTNSWLKKMAKPRLSIVILSYNTRFLLRKCLLSLKKVRNELDFEVIVCDNASVDGSYEMVVKDFPWVKVVKNKKNLGFAKGNNRAKNLVRGEYILFLNSDTLVLKNTLKKVVEYMDKNKDVGALTCKILLPDGSLDKDARRSFITPWVGLTHLILGLDRIFPKSILFATYWYGYISEEKEHEVDVLQGAFLLTKKKILDDVGWFDEEYFLDGEDIDLCWKIKNKGWKIIYYPRVSIVHFKGASKGKFKEIKSVPLSERIKFRMAGVDSMEIFYKKRLWKSYPLVLNFLVLLGIKLIKIKRFLTTLIFR